MLVLHSLRSKCKVDGLSRRALSWRGRLHCPYDSCFERPRRVGRHQLRSQRAGICTAWFGLRQSSTPERTSTDSWELEADDWDRLGDYDDRELLNAVYEEDGSPDSLTQSILALALTILLCAVVGNILVKIALVCWVIVGAAVRYSAVALALIAVGMFFV